MARPTNPSASPDTLLQDLRMLIADTRWAVAQTVNSALVVLYWKVGDRIRRDILKEKRADYGQEILPTLSAKLVPDYGEGFSQRNLARMIRFAQVFPKEEIIHALKRITVGDDDFYLDLLFYHRMLRRLGAIELKLTKFKPAHKGQMELYLRWLEKHEQMAGEEAPIGLILCASKSDEQIELLSLDAGEMRVSTYLTELPPKEVLQKKLHSAIVQARAQLEERGKGSLPTTPTRKGREE